MDTIYVLLLDDALDVDRQVRALGKPEDATYAADFEQAMSFLEAEDEPEPEPLPENVTAMADWVARVNETMRKGG